MAPTIGEWAPDGDGGRHGLRADAAVGPFPPDEIRDAIAGYLGLIHHIDDCVAHVLERYFEYHSRTGRQLEPTCVVFSSDHGEMLGARHQDLVFGDALAVLPVPRRARVAPGQEAGPARRADRALAEGVLEEPAAPRQGVDMRRRSLRCAARVARRTDGRQGPASTSGPRLLLLTGSRRYPAAKPPERLRP